MDTLTGAITSHQPLSYLITQILSLPYEDVDENRLLLFVDASHHIILHPDTKAAHEILTIHREHVFYYDVDVSVRYHVELYNILKSHVSWFIFYQITYYIMSNHILSYPIISNSIISYHMISYPIISYHMLSYAIICYHILSHHIIS